LVIGKYTDVSGGIFYWWGRGLEEGVTGEDLSTEDVSLGEGIFL
jgi:hypothetical protein